jgi:hypothetical protein
VRVMSDLKEAALNRPKDFYAAGALGEPAVVFPFVLSLHTLKEDLGVNDDVGLLDWWDVLKELKRGVLACAIRCSEEGQPVLDALKDLYECDEFCISSIEEGVECEFQWMICQQYTTRNMSIHEAWEEVQSLNLTRSVSNEYTGENVLHVLIVQGGRIDVSISKLFSLVTLQRYKLCLLSAEVLANCIVCDALIHSSMRSHASGIGPLLLSSVRWRHRGSRAYSFAFCGLYRSGACCSGVAASVQRQQAALSSAVETRQPREHGPAHVCAAQHASHVRHLDTLYGGPGKGTKEFGVVAHQIAAVA